jgi:hypothetical protein
VPITSDNLPPVTTLPRPDSPDDDDGRADIRLVEALATFAEDGAENPVLSLLSDARLLVPVVARATGPTGADDDKDTDISAVLMRGRDGRLALLAFTSLDSMQRWNAQARPVPVAGRDAALAASAEDATALLVDLAGPVTFVVESAELAELAAGHVLRPTSVGYAWFAQI